MSVYETFFRGVGAVLIVAVLAIRLYFTVRARRYHEPQPARSGRADGALLRMWVGSAGIIWLALWLIVPQWIVWSSLPFPDGLRWVGVWMALPSLAILTWVHATLDTNFSPRVELARQHQLIKHGPYQWVRHPMYTSFLLVSLALLFISGSSVLGCVTMPGMIFSILQRLPQEEALMVDKFGVEYERYRTCTGAFFPRL